MVWKPITRYDGAILNRQTLAQAISARRVDTSVGEAEAIVELVFGEMAAALRAYGDVTVPLFGRLRAVRRPARQCRNPSTGEMMTIEPKDVVRAKISEVFMRKVFNAT